jgi:hypothetical protein
MTRSRRHRARRGGFSTAEVLAGTSLGLILAASLYSFQQAQLKAFAAQNVYSDSQNVTRTALDLMVRELRMACYDPTGALPKSPGPSCPQVPEGVIQATQTSLRFKQDLDGDGLFTGAGEDVTYDLSNGDLRRTDGTAQPVPLVSGVPSGGLSLRYFDGSNPPVELVPAGSPPALTQGQRDCVTKVQITVTANLTNPRAATPIASVAESEVAIRNRSLMNF